MSAGRVKVLNRTRRLRRRACVQLLSGLLAAAAVAAGPTAEVADDSSCADNNSIFDGTAPLRYAAVVGEPGSRASLHRRFPGHCDPKITTACDGKSYLVPGDPVAIGKTCGSWAYIQFIGAKGVTTGWLPNTSLQDMPPQVDNVAAEYLSGTALLRYRFTLKRGRGIPVCEAYLQRLNITKYLYPPYCNWEAPLSNVIPGFSLIHREPMTATQLWPVISHGYDFLLGQERNAKRHAMRTYSGSGQLTYDPDFSLGDVESLLGGLDSAGLHFTAWMYPDVDIENNGNPGRIMVWRGSIIASTTCNSLWSPTSMPGGGRIQDDAFVMNTSNSDIDDAKTRAVFGDAHGNSIGHAFVPVGNTIALIKYGGEVYFDSFMGRATDLKGKQLGTPAYRVLEVFQRRNAETHPVCAYEVSNDGNE